MKTYLSRLKEKQIKGKIMFQPQIKRKTLLSFLFDWEPLCMLIICINNKSQCSEIKFWTDDKNEAQLELDRFSINHSELKLEQIYG